MENGTSGNRSFEILNLIFLMYLSPTLKVFERRLGSVEKMEKHHPRPGEVVKTCRRSACMLLNQYMRHYNIETKKNNNKLERLKDLSTIKSFPHFVDIFISKPENGLIQFGIEYPGGAVFPFRDLKKALEEAQRISDEFAENESKAA